MASRRVAFVCMSALALSLVASSSDVRADDDDAPGRRDIETENFFGFTEGSGVGQVGDKGLSLETTARIAKGALNPTVGSRYWGSESKLEYEFTPTRSMSIGLGPLLSGHSISNVPDLPNRDQVAFAGFFGEIRYLLLDRSPSSPLAVTLSMEPTWRRIDETSGARVTSFEFETKLNLDYELIENRLYLGSNLMYEPETTHVLGQSGWEKESTVGASLALAYRVMPSALVGVDAWYLHHYDGIFFNSSTGDAVYLGPTLYVQVSEKVYLAAAWQYQVYGHDVEIPGSTLNLADFSRQRAKFKLGFEF